MDNGYCSIGSIFDPFTSLVEELMGNFNFLWDDDANIFFGVGEDHMEVLLEFVICLEDVCFYLLMLNGGHAMLRGYIEHSFFYLSMRTKSKTQN